jgi:hypothetical protein
MAIESFVTTNSIYDLFSVVIRALIEKENVMGSSSDVNEEQKG